MKVILAAVDGSSRAEGVVHAAVALAKSCEAGVVLVQALTLAPELPPAAFAMKPEEVADFVRAHTIERLHALEQAVPQDLRRGVRAAFGAPNDIIDRFAETEDADLIVIGSHGYGGFDKLLGTTAAKIVNHANRSVLVVRAPERFDHHAPARRAS